MGELKRGGNFGRMVIKGKVNESRSDLDVPRAR